MMDAFIAIGAAAVKHSAGRLVAFIYLTEKRCLSFRALHSVPTAVSTAARQSQLPSSLRSRSHIQCGSFSGRTGTMVALRD